MDLLPDSLGKIEWDLDVVTGELYSFHEEYTEDIEESVESSLDEILSKGLLTLPPGLDRGIDFGSWRGAGEQSGLSAFSLIMNASLDSLPADESEDDDHPLKTSNDIDEILPKQVITVDQFKFVQPESRKATSGVKNWARMLDANRIPDDYAQVVPVMAREYPFDLDPFQKQAVYHLEKGDSVFVAAHTSAGKTVVAEYAIALAQKHLTKAIYTSPIKALSNQKFRDFKDSFGVDNVGLLTGDVQLNAEASCLIMTTEILRSMLYKSADLIRDVEYVIFDEVHYVNDAERGVVWEEVIIMLPANVTLIMLSATIPNTLEFADWVGRTKEREIYVISTLKRPVPLEHHLYIANGSAKGRNIVNNPPLVKIVDAGKNFLDVGYKEALRLAKGLSLEDEEEAEKKKGGAAKKSTIGHKTSSTQAGLFRGAQQERNLWIEIIQMLRKRTLLPAVFFTFSKRRCEENANGLSNSLDLNTAAEHSAVHIFLQNSLKKLKGSDAQLPQIIRMRELLGRGIGVHHSGLLPIMKEAVEMLFSRGLVKVLFATETFAMGVNMPARTVVFSSIRKHDGTGFRNLLAGEYTQMAGRAGRRGLDPTGTVIIAVGGGAEDDLPAEITLRTVILGQPTRLTSQFRLTYNMILNLLRVESVRVEEMIRRSFGENLGQKNIPLEQARLAQGEAELGRVGPLDCAICEEDLGG